MLFKQQEPRSTAGLNICAKARLLNGAVVGCGCGALVGANDAGLVAVEAALTALSTLQRIGVDAVYRVRRSTAAGCGECVPTLCAATENVVNQT